MKRDFQTFSINEKKSNFCSNNYFFFKNTAKLHEDLEDITNSFKIINSLYAQPENFKKISTHLNKNRGFQRETPLYFEEINKLINEIKYEEDSNKNDSNNESNEINILEVIEKKGKNISNEKIIENIEMKEINNDPMDIKKKTEKIQNFINQGNISFDGDVTLLEDQTPIIQLNGAFSNNLILENIIEKVAVWEDWEIEILIEVLKTIRTKAIKASKKEAVFKNIFDNFKLLVEKNGKICKKTQNEISSKLYTDVGKLVERNKAKNQKAKDFYNFTKNFPNS